MRNLPRTHSQLLAALLVIATAVALLAAAMPPTSTALAQTGGGYSLTWNHPGSGGLTYSTGGPYRLGGTIGQAAAGPASGSAYTLHGGFWAGLLAWHDLFLPLLRR